MFFLGRGRDDINNLALVSFNTPPDPSSLWLTHKDLTFNFKLYVGLLTVCPPKNMPAAKLDQVHSLSDPLPGSAEGCQRGGCLMLFQLAFGTTITNVLLAKP